MKLLELERLAEQAAGIRRDEEDQTVCQNPHSGTEEAEMSRTPITGQYQRPVDSVLTSRHRPIAPRAASMRSRRER